MPELTGFLHDLNERYLTLHREKETAFWETRMGLAQRHEELAAADVAVKEFLGSASTLARLRELRDSGAAGADESVVLDGWITTFERNQVEDAEAREIQRELAQREAELQKARTGMELGYALPGGGVEPASSVALSNTVRTDPDADRRRSAFEGLRSIETFALENGFGEIVKLRNRFARRLGFPDFYDYKARWAEAFGKETLFGLLDELERRTRDAAGRGLEGLRESHGKEALLPWNAAFHTGGGSLQEEKDAYFRFEDALERWVRSFGALGVRFRDARITLDLVDRSGKYENGFMHGPVPAFRRRGKWLPAEINFTANALPGRTGAGVRAAETLFHEGGHAAHFANVVMDAPCFSQEYAPTSVAFAETQSMFFDRLLSDADWLGRYACDSLGNPIPMALIEREISGTQPHAAYMVRNMLVVCYAEKALYEMAEDDLVPDRILEAFRKVEREVTLLDGGCSRPTLAVPHLLLTESSAYYHGYVLARMAVSQTREHFFTKYGHILDNGAIGPDLARTYWAPGNSRGFRDLVQELTGSPFSADALVKEVSRSPAEAIREARALHSALPRIPEASGEPELDLRLSVIHGAESVVDESAFPLRVSEEFRRWIRDRWPVAKVGTPTGR